MKLSSRFEYEIEVASESKEAYVTLSYGDKFVYFSVGMSAICEYANTFDDIQHIYAEIRYFDGTDLRLRLPAMLAYMFWVQGGYYDERDNVKFKLLVEFTVTISWSVIEYRKQMATSGELGHAMDAVKWGTD
ncbi:hypothetical protein L1987_31585 [Smallanthus sonchifolius]|uniref:Uncharacterized protein n=1 Tax=Smallanthus sonchifolius TaxID=185202 RepID=A0ACB9I600_9ASTR|nr:hypothetical protein L1987_31585 [Smallanthus sonchifolius]